MLTGTKQPEKHCIINKQANTSHRLLRKENLRGYVPSVKLQRSEMQVVPTRRFCDTGNLCYAKMAEGKIGGWLHFFFAFNLCLDTVSHEATSVDIRLNCLLTSNRFVYSSSFALSS